MEFKNYCIIGLGDVSGIRDIISKISDITPRCIEQTGVFIGTFSCVMTANELKDVFDNVNDAIVVTDADFKIQEYNKAFSKLCEEDIDYYGETIIPFLDAWLIDHEPRFIRKVKKTLSYEL